MKQRRTWRAAQASGNAERRLSQGSPSRDPARLARKFPVWSRHLCKFLLNQDKFLPHYHRRANVETTFAMIKAKFCAAILTRLPVAQVNEVLAKCVARNLCCVVKTIFTAELGPPFLPDASGSAT